LKYETRKCIPLIKHLLSTECEERKWRTIQLVEENRDYSE